MKFKQKIGGAVLALALAAGAIPGTISSAAAIELGQHLDHGPKWPHKSIHYVTLFAGIAGLLALVVVTTDGKDKPTSP